jgi:hypothetical protein
LVTARRLASRSSHGTAAASRNIHGATSDVEKQPRLS